ncbi:MAG: hypothetical protein E4G91_08810 [Candidatus Zixiibacteriota bacterium]|nr:MAG: hypothetical protein E4G91_08810 [candidate division Zixibacteria bacterium]
MSSLSRIREGIAQFGWRYLIRVISWRLPDWLFRYESDYLMSAEKLHFEPIQHHDILFRLAEEADADSFAAVRISARTVRERLKLGDKCAIAVREGKTISMLWGATGKLYLAEAGSMIDTGDKAYYRYNSFTVPEERQKGLYRGCSEVLYRYYCSIGKSQLYGVISVFNLPSQIASQKLGNRIVGETTMLALFGVKVIYFKYWPHPTRKMIFFVGRPSADARAV